MRVTLADTARAQLDRLPRTMRARVLAVLHRLEAWPNVSGVKPLRGSLAGRYRIRTGDYRVQFYVTAETIVVERIGHRDGFYEE